LYLLERRYSDYLSESKTDATLTHNITALAIIEAGETALAHSGPAAMRQEMMRAQEQSSSAEGARYYSLARMSAFSGEVNQAIRYLKKAFDLHDVNMVTLTADPFFASIRDRTTFQDLVKRVGVVH
jgi:hypothetical protein